MDGRWNFIDFPRQFCSTTLVGRLPKTSIPNAAMRKARPNGTPQIANGMILLRKKLARMRIDASTARLETVIFAIRFDVGLIIG